MGVGLGKLRWYFATNEHVSEGITKGLFEKCSELFDPDLHCYCPPWNLLLACWPLLLPFFLFHVFVFYFLGQFSVK